MKLEPFSIPIDFSPEKIEEIEAKCLTLPQIEIPVTHSHAPGVYIREILMPKGTFVIGHEHKTEHFNLVLSGVADVVVNGKVERIEAPCYFVCKAGVRKMFYIIEDMRFANVHPNPTDEKDVDTLEGFFLVKSESYLNHKQLEGGKTAWPVLQLP